MSSPTSSSPTYKISSGGGGVKKHKKHKSEHQQQEQQRPLKLILKVGGAAPPTSTTASDSSDITAVDIGSDDMSGSEMTPTGVVGGVGEAAPHQMGVANIAADDSPASLLLLDHGHLHHHKKSKKKKRKKEHKKEKKHHHHHHHHHHHNRHHKEKKRKRLDDEYDSTDGGGVATVGSPLREPRTCVLRKIQERGAVHKMLEQLLPLLEKRDPQQFFAWPVTDTIAPGYSAIIQQPMDFSTMRHKIENNDYVNLQEFIEDFKLMCTNAMLYNHAETIYYKASKKLLHAGLKMMQTDKLSWLIQLIPDLTSEHVGFEITPEMRISKQQQQQHQQLHVLQQQQVCAEEALKDETPPTCAVEGVKEDDENQQLATSSTTTATITTANNNSNKSRMMPSTKFEAIGDDLTSDEILQKAQTAAREARAKLMRKPSGPTIVGYLRQRNKDGGTHLNVIVGGDGANGGGGGHVGGASIVRKRPVLLGQLCGKLSEGTGQLQGYREDRRNCVKSVKPLYYGAFGSYAPSYDSAFANLTKEESDLVTQTYGGQELGQQYAESLLDFVRLGKPKSVEDETVEGGDTPYIAQLVDSLLDALTGGEHSRTKHVLDGNRRLRTEEATVQRVLDVQPLDAVSVDVDSLRTLSTDFGLDMSFLEGMGAELKAVQARHAMQQQLDQMCGLLERLHRTQLERLSRPPPPHLSQCVGPAEGELQLADNVTQQLTEIVRQVGGPATVSSVGAVRKAMGVPPPPPPPPPPSVGGEGGVPDLELELRQFLDSDCVPLRDDNTSMIDEMLLA